MISTKRVYDPPAKSDGNRILVDRLWPRGLSKEKAKVDFWLKEIAPSDELRKWIHADKSRWDEFVKRYAAELKENPEPLKQLREIIKERKTVTLLFSASDVEQNNALTLRDFLSKA
jgi:uncharacterized protein YeaO (DUF488 family)